MVSRSFVKHFSGRSHVLGEHAEQAAHEEARDQLRMMPFALQGAGHDGKMTRNPAGDLGGAPGRVERERIGPDQAQPLADVRVAQGVERNAEGLGVRELAVALSGPAEVGIELEAVADIDDDQEGRPAMVDRQGLGIALGLAAGALHGDGPVRGAAHGGAFAGLGLGAAEEL